MSHIIADRVKEKIQSPASTGILSLLNTTSGYRRFSSVMSSGDTCYYCLECPSNGDWECGLGTYSSNNALSRTAVYSSSNGGAVVNFANRVSYVFISYVASRAIYLDPSGELNLALNTLNDVGLTAPASGQSLVYNGSSWANTTITGYTTEEAQDAVGGILTDTSSISFSYNDGAPSISASVKNSGVTNDMLATGIDTSKIGDGGISLAEFGYLNGVTSSLQVQLDSKYDSANPSGYISASGVAAAYQPLDADLTSLASASGSGIYERSGGSWTPVVIGTGLSLGSGILSNTLDLSSYLTSSVATATYLPLAGGTLTGDLKFTDATYDIGKSGATRPRDGFFSRNITYGGQLMVPVGSQYAASIQNSQFGTGAGINFTAGGTYFIDNNSAVVHIGVGGQSKLVIGCDLRFASSIGATEDLYVVRSAADTLALRRTTNAQAFQLYETYSSSTSFGTLQLKANAGAAYQIGSAIGSAGGTNRDLNFGSWDTAGTFTAALTVDTVGKVGIGTSSPGKPFDLAKSGADASTNHAAFRTRTTGTSAYGPAFYIDGSSITGGRSWSMFTAGNLDMLTTGSFYFYDATAGASRFVIDSSGNIGIGTVIPTSLLHVVQSVSTTGSPTAFTLTGAAHTTLTLSTEATDVNFNLSRTVQFATGALTTQRAMRIQAPTYSFVGASTITTASTLSISGPPVAGTNATITNKYALNVESGNVRITDGNLTLTSSESAGSAARGGISMRGWLTMAGADNYFTNMVYFNQYSCIHAINGNAFGLGTSTAVNGWYNGTVGFYWKKSATQYYGWSRDDTSNSTGGSYGFTSTVNDVIEQRSGTNAQRFGVSGTWTSATSYERVNVRGKASANFEIGPENGSAGGTLRGLTLGGYTAGSATITPWLSFTSSGNASFSQYATIQGGVLVEAGGSYTTSYASPAQVRVRRAQGTQASPTQVTTGVQLGIIGAQGLNDAGAYAGYTSYISFNAGENITTTGCGGYFNFYTTPVGSLTEVMRTWIGAAGNFGIGVFAAEPSTLLTINGDMLRLMVSKTPATSGAAGNAGEICWDTTYLYGCTATNTWKRIAWTTF